MMLKKNQQGMASLVICMLLMIIISLMTLSFATLSRREQRQALDKQLATQAFYAAETGINDAAKAILDKTLTTDVLDCSAIEQAKINPTGISGTLDASSSTIRTCVFVDQSPSQIDDVVGETESTVFPISATNIASIDIYWENDSAVAIPEFPALDTAAGSFTTDAGWVNERPGVLVIQLIPFPATGTDRTTIANNTIYVLGFPTSSSSNQSANGTTSNGQILTGGCASANTGAPNNWPRQCKVSITGLTNQKYYIRLKAIYDPVHITIEAKDGSGVRLPLVGAQVLIDSTGRANDVTKRIKIYNPIRSSASLPGSVLEIGGDLCKRLLSNPVDTTTDTPSILSCVPSYQP